MRSGYTFVACPFIFVSAKMKFAIALLMLVPFIVAAETEEKRQFDLLNIASSKPLNFCQLLNF